LLELLDDIFLSFETKILDSFMRLELTVIHKYYFGSLLSLL
jgi:hypothetical protein